METGKLWLNDDFIIVEKGGRKERELLALGWLPEKPKKPGKAQKPEKDHGDISGKPENEPPAPA